MEVRGEGKRKNYEITFVCPFSSPPIIRPPPPPLYPPHPPPLLCVFRFSTLPLNARPCEARWWELREKKKTAKKIKKKNILIFHSHSFSFALVACLSLWFLPLPSLFLSLSLSLSLFLCNAPMTRPNLDDVDPGRLECGKRKEEGRKKTKFFLFPRAVFFSSFSLSFSRGRFPLFSLPPLSLPPSFVSRKLRRDR